ncbi:MAG: terminase small subunit [Candidatus Hydrogenedentota bacterium]
MNVREEGRVTLERVIEELTAIATADIEGVFEQTTKGLRVRSFENMPAGARACIKSILIHKDGACYVKLYSKARALKLLNKYRRLFERQREEEARTIINFEIGGRKSTRNAQGVDAELEVDLRDSLGTSPPQFH